MITKNLYIFLGLSLLLLTSCGYQEGVREPDRQSYVRFLGETQGAVAHIDGGEPIAIEGTYRTNTETGEKIKKNNRTLYQVKPGKHDILVEKDGKVVVRRSVMINAGSTKEIHVP